jgi:DNA invertase Pin-like site-specific DNA recombinase
MVVDVVEQRRSVRGKRLAVAQQKRVERRDRTLWRGEAAAIYCRISHTRDEDQTGVDRQERLCRGVIERLGLAIEPRHVFVDNNRSAWQRGRKRKSWDQLLATLRAGEVRHVVVYHADRLMRQPRDLEELLNIADEQNITLHGEANERDLSDPDDRFFLRIEVAHACRSSDDASRRLKAEMVDRAHDGRPHTGKRKYGYEKNAKTIVPHEAAIVVEVFTRYLSGESVYKIARDLNERGEPTALGAKWASGTVLSLLDSRHVAGILVFRGEEIGRGEWEPIVSEGLWNEVRARREYRNAVHVPWRAQRYYLLRGLTVCKRCGIGMGGSSGQYACNRRDLLDETRCKRSINAAKLEEFVVEAALRRLEGLATYDSSDAAVAVMTDADRAAIEEDQQELAELRAAWDAREIKTREYRQMRKQVEDRIAAIQTKTAIRPTAEVLQGIIGKHARPAWQRLADAGEHDRMNAILRFLFAAVVISESTARKGHFDYDRIDIEVNPL